MSLKAPATNAPTISNACCPCPEAFEVGARIVPVVEDANEVEVVLVEE
jgi:hypothetical protein